MAHHECPGESNVAAPIGGPSQAVGWHSEDGSTTTWENGARIRREWSTRRFLLPMNITSSVPDWPLGRLLATSGCEGALRIRAFHRPLRGAVASRTSMSTSGAARGPLRYKTPRQRGAATGDRPLLRREMGRPPMALLLLSCAARRVVAKVEWHRGELFPRVGFIVTIHRLRGNSALSSGWGSAKPRQAVKHYGRCLTCSS